LRVKEVFAIGVPHPIGHTLKGYDSADNGNDVDRVSCQVSDRGDQQILEVLSHPGLAKFQTGPVQPENPGCDRTARNARYSVQLGKVAELVKTPDRADMKQHRAIAAAREAQCYAFGGLRQR